MNSKKQTGLIICLIYFAFTLHFLISITYPLNAGDITRDDITDQSGTSEEAEQSNEKSEGMQYKPVPDKTSNDQKKNVNISVSAGTGIMQGHTTYQIGGHFDSPEGSGEFHFPLSELIFPLNTYLISLETNILLFKKWKADAKFQTNIKRNTDNMKDSDWGIPFEDPPNSGNYYWYGPDHLDIYSESKTELSVYIFAIDLLYRFYRFIPGSSSSTYFNFYAGLGYLYQQYEFECRLIRQWDYREDNPEPQDATGDGSIVLTYDIFTHIPYIKINSEIYFKSMFSINASIGYSPFIKLKDKDNHILRSKKSYAECDGNALLLSLAGKIDLSKSVFIKLQVDYVSIETEGKQKQYEYGVWVATIDQKNFSKRKSAELTIGYNF